jgi:hypothetical protein
VISTCSEQTNFPSSYNDIEKAIKNGDYETAKAGGSTDKAKEARESKEKR